MALPYFFHVISRTVRLRGKKLLTINLCSNIFYKFCLNYFALWHEFSEISWMYTGLHINFPLSWSDFNETWFFPTNFQKKNPQIPNCMKIRPEEANFFHADGWMEWQTNGRIDKLKNGQTDMRNLIFAFRNFGNPPKSVTIIPASKYALLRAIQ